LNFVAIGPGSSSKESAMEVSGTLAVEPFGAVVLDGTEGRAAAPPQAQESSLVQPMPNIMSAEEEKKLEQDGTGDDKESIKVDLSQQATNAAHDSTSNLHASVAANGCTTDVTVLDKWPTDLQNMLETSNGSTQSQDQSRLFLDSDFCSLTLIQGVKHSTCDSAMSFGRGWIEIKEQQRNGCWVG
jgi:hypothetical protein